MLETLTIASEVSPVSAPDTVATCSVCGAATAPSGACLEIGTCERADIAATRGATGRTAKYAVPAAWNARGRVD